MNKNLQQQKDREGILKAPKPSPNKDGEYGAGTVKLYTKGTWREIKWGKEIQFEIDSPKMKGRITLFKRFGKNWMGIFKETKGS